MVLKTFKNLLSASTTTTATIPNEKTIFSMNNWARDSAVAVETRVDTTN
jgi:hypothetical protein